MPPQDPAPRRRRLSEMNPDELRDATVGPENKKNQIPLKLFLQGFLLSSVLLVVVSICVVLVSFIDSTAEQVGQQLAVKYASNVVSKVVLEIRPVQSTVSALHNLVSSPIASNHNKNASLNATEGSSTTNSSRNNNTKMNLGTGYWKARLVHLQQLHRWTLKDVSICLVNSTTTTSGGGESGVPETPSPANTVGSSSSGWSDRSDANSDFSSSWGGTANSPLGVAAEEKRRGQELMAAQSTTTSRPKVTTTTRSLIVYALTQNGIFLQTPVTQRLGSQAMSWNVADESDRPDANHNFSFALSNLSASVKVQRAVDSNSAEEGDDFLQQWWNVLVEGCLQELTPRDAGDNLEDQWRFYSDSSLVEDAVKKNNKNATNSSAEDNDPNLIKGTVRLTRKHQENVTGDTNTTLGVHHYHASLARVTKTLTPPDESEINVDPVIRVKTTTAVYFSGTSSADAPTVLMVVPSSEQRGNNLASLPSADNSIVGTSSGSRTFDAAVDSLSHQAPSSAKDFTEANKIKASVAVFEVPDYAKNVVGACYITRETLHSEIKEGSRVMILASVLIAFSIGVAGSLFVHVLVRPMLRLRDEMSRVGRLEIDGLINDDNTQETTRSDSSSPKHTNHREKSSIAELSDITVYLRELAEQVKAVKEVLQGEKEEKEEGEQGENPLVREESGNASFGGTMTMNDLGSTFNNFGGDDSLRMQSTFSVHSTLIELTYESRQRDDVIARADFDLVYADQEEDDLLGKLVAECKESVDEHEFEEVTLIHRDHETQEEVLLRSAMQLQELLSTAPEKLQLTMYKARKAQYRMLVTPMADLTNAFVTVIFVWRLLTDPEDKYTTATVAFTVLYLFALGMNAAIAFGLLRSSSDHFQRWLAQASVEVALAMVVSILNPQNMQLMWSQIRVKKRLRFNGPEDSKLAQRSISWSLFGFLFSDVSQLMFKIWLLYVSSKIDPFNFFALATSGVSVAFNLVLRLHAMFLWHSTQDDENDPFFAGNGLGEHMAEGSQLVKKEVSLVHVHFPMPAHVQQINLQGFEYNTFYTSVFAALKQQRGSVLWAHGGDVVAIFNVQRKSQQHALDALAFAHNTVEQGKRKGQRVVCGVACGTYPVGMLGTVSSKALHCFGPLGDLSKLVLNCHFNGGMLVMNQEAAAKIRALRTELREKVDAAPEDDLFGVHSPSSSDFQSRGGFNNSNVFSNSDFGSPQLSINMSSANYGSPRGSPGSTNHFRKKTPQQLQLEEDKEKLQFLNQFKIQRILGLLPQSYPLVVQSGPTLGPLLSRGYLVTQHGDEVSRDLRLAQVAYALGLAGTYTSTSSGAGGDQSSPLLARSGNQSFAASFDGPVGLAALDAVNFRTSGEDNANGNNRAGGKGLERLKLERRIAALGRFYADWARQQQRANSLNSGGDAVVPVGCLSGSAILRAGRQGHMDL